MLKPYGTRFHDRGGMNLQLEGMLELAHFAEAEAVKPHLARREHYLIPNGLAAKSGFCACGVKCRTRQAFEDHYAERTTEAPK